MNEQSKVVCVSNLVDSHNNRIVSCAKMKVVDFLNSNSLDQLKTQFSIKVKEYADEGLLVLNYTIFSPENDRIVKECRSLILTTDYGIVSRSFDRFFNYNEMNEGNVVGGDSECYAKEKVDGSLIKFYKFNGKWNVSTRGLAFAEGSIGDTRTTYKEAVYQVLNITDDVQFQRFCQDCNMYDDCTYIFELTGKHNRIITLYDPNKYELWLLGIRRNDSTGEYMDINTASLGPLNELIRKPREYRFRNLTECVSQANNLVDLQEGFVVCNKTTGHPLCKVKSSKYVSFHKVTMNGPLSTRGVWKLIVNEDCKEFAAYFPEYADTINKHWEIIQQYFVTAGLEFEEIRRTMKFENDFSVFDRKMWKSLAIIAVKTGQSDIYEIFMNAFDQKKKLSFLSKALDGK